MANVLDENWQLLQSLLPMGWQEQAILSGALERLRGFDSPGDLLRVLLLHVAKGYSLRETAVRARHAGLAQVSDVALLKRLRNSDDWWRRMCLAMLQERGWGLTADSRGYQLRVLDGTLVKEPGRFGQLWRIHYSLRLPTLECDHLEVTPANGAGTGEKLSRFAARPGDLILADRGFCKPGEVAMLHRQGAAVIVRLNTASLPLWEVQGERRFNLLGHVRSVTTTGAPAEWPVSVRSGTVLVGGRVCIVRKSEQAIERSHRRIRRKVQQGGPQSKPETLEYAAYIMVFTTLPAMFPAADVLELYRVRWQIELQFKRLKSLARLGHLPKHDPHSARAWLYGKLLVALLADKLARLGRDISPWGYNLREMPPAEPLAPV